MTRREFPGDARALSEQLGTVKAPSADRRHYTVEVVTPIMGGGVEPGVPDVRMPMREKALRGQIRAWWRLLASLGMLPRQQTAWTGAKLFAEEAKLFGGMLPQRERGNMTWRPASTKVRLIVEPCSKPQLFGFSTRQVLNREGRPLKDKRGFEKQGDVISPLLGGRTDGTTGCQGIEYALFSAKSQKTNHLQAKKLIAPGLSFSLAVEIADSAGGDANALLDEVELCVRWWASFGGIGARTRRGAGTVRVVTVPTLGESEVLCAILPDRDAVLAVMRKKGFRVVLGKPGEDAMKAWNAATLALKEFRQGARLGRVRDRSYSNWPEPDALRTIFNNGNPQPRGQHQITHPFVGVNGACWFPRAAFGLPIRIPFQQGKWWSDPAESTLSPEGSDRLASPLIVKAMALPRGQFVPVALVLPLDHAARCRPGRSFWEAPLELDARAWKGRGHEDTIPHLKMWPADRATQDACAQTIVPIKGHSDPLSAFLAYFGKATT
jgi:CRISPR-associated protein Cmr1